MHVQVKVGRSLGASRQACHMTGSHQMPRQSMETLGLLAATRRFAPRSPEVTGARRIGNWHLADRYQMGNWRVFR